MFLPAGGGQFLLKAMVLPGAALRSTGEALGVERKRMEPAIGGQS